MQFGYVEDVHREYVIIRPIIPLRWIDKPGLQGFIWLYFEHDWRLFFLPRYLTAAIAGPGGWAMETALRRDVWKQVMIFPPVTQHFGFPIPAVAFANQSHGQQLTAGAGRSWAGLSDGYVGTAW